MGVHTFLFWKQKEGLLKSVILNLLLRNIYLRNLYLRDIDIFHGCFVNKLT